MFIIISIFVIAVCAIIAIIRSEKSLKHILTEAKYEVVYNIIGSKALMEDFLRRGANKTGKFIFISIYYSSTKNSIYFISLQIDK